MGDTVDKRTRSRMMAGIRGKNTRPERIVRKGLHAKGLRFRLHSARLPGHPDLVFPKWQAVVFVHGCFWHGHQCKYFRIPKTRSKFWEKKIDGNRDRDERHRMQLRKLGWRVGIVWECATRGIRSSNLERMLNKLSRWIRRPNSKAMFIRGPR